MASVDEYFSVLALFILFRETIEASIICGVLLSFLNRAKPLLKKAVWTGVAAGVGVSIIFGVIFIAVYYAARDNLFRGKNRDWFKGIISWIAGVLITILAFAMLRFLGWEAKWRRKLEAALKEKAPDVLLDADGSPAAGLSPDSAADTKGSTIKEAEDREANPESEATANPTADGPSPVSQTSSVRAEPVSDPQRRQGSIEQQEQRQKQPPPQVQSPLHQEASGLDASMITPTTTSSEPDSENDGLKKPAIAASASASAADPPALEVVEVKVADHDEKSANNAVSAMLADGRDLTPPSRKQYMSIWVLVFTTVVREGIESVVFLGGLANVKVSAIPLPAFVGIVCGCLVGVFLYYSGRQVKDIKWVVIIMAIVLFFIAAGQINIGTDSLMRAGMFGECSPWLDERPWYMRPVYDWSGCCSDTDPKGNEPTDTQNRKRFFALARAIFGYQDKATPLELIIYCSYWGLTIIIAAWKWWRGTLFDADYKYTREQKRLVKEARLREEAEAREAALLEGGSVKEDLKEEEEEERDEEGKRRCCLGRALWSRACGWCWRGRGAGRR